MSRYSQIPESENKYYQDTETKQLPKTTVLRLIAENLPPSSRFDKHFGILMTECGTEFVKMITSVGYEIAEREGMSTITPRHIVATLIELGYEEYVDKVQRVVDELQENKRLKQREKKQKRIAVSSSSQEKLLKQQEELFDISRARFQLNQNGGLM